MGKVLFPKARCNVKTLDIPFVMMLLSDSTHDLPITSLIEVIHESIQNVYIQRSEHGGELFGELTTYAEMVLRKRKHKFVNWQARSVYDDNFEVADVLHTGFVHLGRMIC